MSAETQTQTEDAQTQTNPIYDLTGFQRDILVAARDVDTSDDDEGPSGQSIKTFLEKAGYGNINHGRLYPNLDEVVEQGLVEKGQLDRRTNWYKVSDKGEQALEEYAEFVGGSE